MQNEKLRKLTIFFSFFFTPSAPVSCLMPSLSISEVFLVIFSWHSLSDTAALQSDNSHILCGWQERIYRTFDGQVDTEFLQQWLYKLKQNSEIPPNLSSLSNSVWYWFWIYWTWLFDTEPRKSFWSSFNWRVAELQWLLHMLINMFLI